MMEIFNFSLYYMIIKALRYTLLISFFIYFDVCAWAAATGSIRPENLRCEYLTDPKGLDELLPRLSWTLAATDTFGHGQAQSAYRILVATATGLLKQSKGDQWDSGWIRSDEMQHVVYEGKPLTSDRTYYWKVCVKDENSRLSAWSDNAYWTTGLLKPSEWKAKWIGSNVVFDPKLPSCNIPDPWIRKTFDLKMKPGRSIFYVASVGYHELYINGRRVGKEVLAPAATDHSKRARYIAYDIAPYLKAGKNVAALWLGTSWSIYGPYLSSEKPNTPIVSGQCTVYREKEPKPGTVPLEVIVTDKTWKIHASPGRLTGTWNAGNMGGEFWDAGKEDKTWNTLACNETSWAAATEYHPALRLSAQQVEGNRLFDEIRPVSIEEQKNGQYRVDMGVNFAGWTEVKVNGNPGDKIEFLYSEREQEDMTFGLHSIYIIGKTGKGTFRNRFNYSSCRWITIKGLKNKPGKEDIRGWLVRTAYMPAAEFSCSDSLQNWIYDKVKWTFENLSLGGYVVDCPQRERMGYGGDAHATSETGLFNFKMEAFYTKWMEDWRDVKGTESVVGNMYDPNFAHKGVMGGRYLHPGILPHTAPTYAGGGGPAWGGIVVTLPWTFYQHEGDKRILEKNFGLIKDWLLFLDTQTSDNLLQRFGGSWDFLGDWLWPNATAEGMNNNKPETLCLNNCYRVYNLRTAAKIARTINRVAEAESWEAEAERYSRAIHKRFYNEGDSSYADSSMANLAAALLAEVPPAGLREEVMQRLAKEILIVRNGHIHVGITAGALLFKLLREKGRDDLIYSMTSQKDYPGWGYMKSNGATTLWEMWEKDLPGHSLLHSSFLYPGAWYIDGVAGIKRDTLVPGFRRFIVRPPLLTARQISWARASFDSPAGRILSSWSRKDGVLSVEVIVPPNCTAEVQISAAEAGDTSFNAPYLKNLGVQNGYLRLQLQSGRHILKTNRNSE